jgi:hypothetical protein
VKKYIVMVLTSALAAASILYLQAKFDSADERSAINVVQTYRARSGRSLPEVIAEQNPGNKGIEWSAATESSCRQHERVRAQVLVGDSVVAYDFIVDINRPSIHPGNEIGKRGLEALGP